MKELLKKILKSKIVWVQIIAGLTTILAFFDSDALRD